MNIKPDKYKRTLAFLAALILITGTAFADTSKQQWYSQVFANFCKNKFKEFNDELNLITPSDERYASSRLLTLLTKEGQVQAAAKSKANLNDVSIAPEPNRIADAAFLLQSSYGDFKKIRDLLDFHSVNNQTEALRLGVLSSLEEIEGNPEKSLKLKMEAFLMSPDFDELILSEIFTSAAKDRNATLILKPYVGYIDKVPATSPTKYELMALEELVFSQDKSKEKISLNFKKAYEMCPDHQVHVLNYVSVLLNENEAEKAEKILTDVVSSNVFYSPYVDYFLMKINFENGNKDQGEVFLNKALVRKAYLQKAYQIDIENIRSKELRPHSADLGFP